MPSKVTFIFDASNVILDMTLDAPKIIDKVYRMMVDGLPHLIAVMRVQLCPPFPPTCSSATLTHPYVARWIVGEGALLSPSTFIPIKRERERERERESDEERHHRRVGAQKARVASESCASFT